MHVLSTSDEDVITKDGDEVLYGGVGIKYRASLGLGVRLDVRAMFPPSSADEFAAFDAEVLLSIYKEWGRKETVAVVAPREVIGDSDGDGLKDDVDICPKEPEDADGFEDEDGCPDTDDDEDGVLDTSDGCRTEPEDRDGFEDEDGCPELDNDKDGILDLAPDECLTDPEDLDGFEDENGCPDPDNDQDGVLDVAPDRCPESKETMNGYQDEDGCYDDVPKAVSQFTGVIKGITFKVDSADILKSSNKTLNAAVKVLQEYPDTRLEIQGHTDDTGDDAYNKDLSQRRAEAVKAYLVGKGIDESRLVAVGYGRDVPLDERKTKSARAKNRRVEFKLMIVPSASPETP